MTSTTTPPAMILAGIIRQVWKKDLGAEALAEAILTHPGSRWAPAQPAACEREHLEAWLLEHGYEQIFDDGDPEKLPRDAQQIGGKWWRPRFGCDSLANVLEAAKIELNPNGKNRSLILDYLQQVATLPTAWPTLPEINDNLIKSLINGVLSINELAIDEYCQGRCCNAVDEFRPRLMEILQLAAQEEKERSTP